MAFEKGNDIKNSDSIQATRWSALNAFFSFLLMEDLIDINPMTKTKRPKNRTEKPIVYLCIKKINDNHINNILDTYYHGNVEYDSKTKLRNYKSYKNKINSLEKEFPSYVGIICINTKNFSEEDFEKNLRILKLLFKFEQIYYIDNNKFSVIIENDDSEEFQLKLLQIYELFCANNLKDKIKIASCWSDDEDKGLEYIFKIIERKLYKADTIKE